MNKKRIKDIMLLYHYTNLWLSASYQLCKTLLVPHKNIVAKLGKAYQTVTRMIKAMDMLMYKMRQTKILPSR